MSEIRAEIDQVKELKERIERYLWNLGGCSTYALGYDLEGGHDKEMALPALDDVLKLALEKKALTSQVALLQAENEKLNNRVQLLSVSANTIRDAYDNGLNAELQAQVARMKVALEFALQHHQGLHSPVGRAIEKALTELETGNG